MIALSPPRLACRQLNLGSLLGVCLSLEKGPFAQVPEVIPLVATETGKPLARQTKAKMAWDQWGVYCLFECEDPSIWSPYSDDNDEIYYADVVEFFISPDGSKERYFEFELSPGNVRFAAEIHNPGGSGQGYYAKEMLDCSSIKSRVFVDGRLAGKKQDRLWRALLGVPYSLMGVKVPQSGDQWKANLLRIDLPNPEAGEQFEPEFGAWSPSGQSPANFHLPDCFGTIDFI